MRSLIIGLILSITPAWALAAAKPTAEETNKVLDYYYNGKGLGPVLLESKICRDIQREGDEKNECAGEISDGDLKLEESVYLWMSFMAPVGSEPQNIIVQFENGGITRNVKTFQVNGGLRYRTWLKISLNKIGRWNIKLAHDAGADVFPLGERQVTVE